MAGYENISPEEAAKLITAGECYVIDVRTPKEFRSHRINGAYLLPIQEISTRHHEIPRGSAKKLVFVCEHGVRSVHVCDALAKGGWTNLVNMSGGMADWVELKLPFTSGEQKDTADLGPKK